MKFFTIFFLLFALAFTSLGQNDIRSWDTRSSLNLDFNFSDSKVTRGIEITSPSSVVLYVKDSEIYSCKSNCRDTLFLSGINEKREEITLKIRQKTSQFKLQEGKVLEILNEDATLSIEVVGQSNQPDEEKVNTAEDLKEGILSKEINVFYDAVALMEFPDSRKSILEKYEKDINNIYINSYYDPKGLQKNSTMTGLFENLGNADITKISDKVVNHTIKMAKRELAITFFENFQATINDSSKFRDLQIVFPETWDKLNFIGERIYEFEPYLNDIRTSAISDLKLIPFRLSNVLKDQNTQLSKVVSKKPNLKYSLGVSFNLIDELNSSDNFGIAISKLNTSNTTYYKDTPEVLKIKTSIELAKLFSYAFKDSITTDSTYYLSKGQMHRLLKEDLLLKNFIGLTLASRNFKELDITSKDEIFRLLNKKQISDEIEVFYDVISSFIAGTESIFRAKSETGSVKNSLYFEGAEKIIHAGKLISEKFINTDQVKVDTVFLFLEYSLGLTKHIYNKEYTSAVGKAVGLYSLLPGSKEDFQRKAYRYGTFLAQLAAAEDGDEIAQVLEYFAAPLGSFRDKKLGTTVAIDAFIGGHRGGFLNDYSSEEDFWAVSTPIGISFSFPIKPLIVKKREYSLLSSLTVMPVLFDLGALSLFRIQSSDTLTSKIYLKEIISPGIFLSLGLGGKNWPVFLNAGLQSYPLLRSVSSTEIITNLNRTPGWNLGLAVNVPLFTLYKK